MRNLHLIVMSCSVYIILLRTSNELDLLNWLRSVLDSVLCSFLGIRSVILCDISLVADIMKKKRNSISFVQFATPLDNESDCDSHSKPEVRHRSVTGICLQFKSKVS